MDREVPPGNRPGKAEAGPPAEAGPGSPARARLAALLTSWSLAGVLIGLAGLATSFAAASALSLRESPVVAVAELVVRLVPGPVTETAIGVLGTADKPALIAGILVILLLLFAYAGRLARRAWWCPLLVWLGLGTVGFAAVLTAPAVSSTAVVPIGVGLATWILVGSLLTEPLRTLERRRAALERAASEPGTTGTGRAPAPGPLGETRRLFLVRAGAVTAAAGVVGLAGRLVGRGRRQVERTRGLLKLPISRPVMPSDVRVDLDGADPWETPNTDFYLIHTALLLPTIDPDQWTLRIHGMVENEMVLTYEDLLRRGMTESWITLGCVSNPVGGTYIGNAWWSGVRIADILAEAGVSPDADAVKQTSQDGWTCGTPVSALTDGRDAMLAVGMNGKPLPVEHGFPVRMVVPGLYGFVSATKWVVDLEVTRFEDFDAYWTTKGWGEQAPVRIASRIDVPGSGDEVPAGEVRVGGVAWHQHTGVEGVQVAVDGGDWQDVSEIGSAPSDDTWVQWAATIDVDAGDHELRVRAVGKDGEVQTGVSRDEIPDGATGWHAVDFSAT